MVSAVDVWQRDQRVAEGAGRAGRLRREHVEADANAALADRVFERRVIDDLRARGVDEVRPGLQRVEHRGVHQPPCLRVERKMHAEDIAPRREVHRRRGELHRDRLVRDLVPAGREPSAPDDHRHSERVSAPRDLLADVAVAEQADRAAVQPARLRVLLLVPAPRAKIGHVVRHAPVQ